MSPRPIDRATIEAAAARIAGHVRTTPILDVGRGTFGVEATLTLKLENLQHTGSFKARGAFNNILAAPVPDAGVVAASGGNHGLAVAYAAGRLGHRAEIFVPESTPAVKIDRIRAAGAHVVVTGAAYAEALEASLLRAAATGARTVHAYDQPATVAGQGTLGRELHRQAPTLDTVLVAVGGGGLIGGIASWYRGDVRVVAVEPETAPTLHAARAAGGPVDIPAGGITADSLGARRIGDIAFAVARAHVADSVLVSDDAIRDAQQALWAEVRIVAELGGAATLAALRSGAYVPAAGERVGVLVCGANTDPSAIGA